MLGVGWSEELALEDFSAWHQVETIREVFGEEFGENIYLLGLEKKVDGAGFERGGAE